MMINNNHLKKQILTNDISHYLTCRRFAVAKQRSKLAHWYGMGCHRYVFIGTLRNRMKSELTVRFECNGNYSTFYSIRH